SGSAVGPLLAAAIIVPNGQASVAWLMIFAIFAIYLLYRISRWTIQYGVQAASAVKAKQSTPLKGSKLVQGIVIICALMFAKFTYIASIGNYYTFYLIEKFQVSI